jgi:hypothetical protein
MERSNRPLEFLYALLIASQSRGEGRLDPLYRPFLLIGLLLTACIRSLIGVVLEVAPQLAPIISAEYFGVEAGYLFSGLLALALTSGLERRAPAIQQEFSWLPPINTFPRKSGVFLLALAPAALGAWFSFREPAASSGALLIYFLLLGVLQRSLGYRIRSN